MNNTMIRRASELDVNSLVVVDGVAIRVTEIHDVVNEFGAFVSIRFAEGSAIFERASALYTCVAGGWRE